MRLGAIFVAICMVIIAGSAGALVYLAFGLAVSEAIVVALAIMTALGLYNVFSSRVGAGSAVGQQITDLSRGSADLARQVAEMGRRLAAAEGRIEGALDKTRTVTDPITVEIGELGTLVKHLAETVAAQQTAIIDLSKRPPTSTFLPAPAFQSISPTPAILPIEPAPPAAIEPKPLVATSGLSSEASNEAALAAIRGAIEANRVDLFLQPIVTLPQRKVRFYEAMSRLRTDSGDVLQAADYIARAEAAGLMPKVDNLVTFRCVQVVRRLLLKNRDIGLFCNLSGSTLTDSFPQFLEFLDANRAIAPSLVLEFTQSAVRAMGPIEHEALAALAERGYRFSMDNVADMRIEPRELAGRNFRFIKVPASFLLNRSTTATDIHPADLSDLVGRFGIDLVADKIESEGSVVDLLDYDVRYGQGFLFSPPRPVRAEALQGIAERSDVVARETSAPEEQASQSGGGLRIADAGAPKEERTTGLAQLARGVVSRG